MFALVSSRSARAVSLYLDRAAAERELAEILGDEPGFRDILSIVELDSFDDEPESAEARRN